MLVHFLCFQRVAKPQQQAASFTLCVLRKQGNPTHHWAAAAPSSTQTHATNMTAMEAWSGPGRQQRASITVTRAGGRDRSRASRASARLRVAELVLVQSSPFFSASPMGGASRGAGGHGDACVDRGGAWTAWVAQGRRWGSAAWWATERRRAAAAWAQRCERKRLLAARPETLRARHAHAHHAYVEELWWAWVVAEEVVGEERWIIAVGMWQLCSPRLARASSPGSAGLLAAVSSQIHIKCG